MNCPKCGKDNNIVIDVRHRKKGYRRWRKCLICGNKFSTVEELSKKSFNEVLRCQM